MITRADLTTMRALGFRRFRRAGPGPRPMTWETEGPITLGIFVDDDRGTVIASADTRGRNSPDGRSRQVMVHTRTVAEAIDELPHLQAGLAVATGKARP